MRYVSTRGRAPIPRFRGRAPRGARIGRRPLRPRALAGPRPGRAGFVPWPRLRRGRLRDPLPLHRRHHRAGGVARDHRRGLRRVRSPRGGAARADRAGPLAAGAVPWADPRVQGRRTTGARPALRPRPGTARRAHHDRRGDLRRHRLGRHRGVPWPRTGVDRHPPSRGQGLGGPAPADDDGGGRQRPQRRGRRDLRRLPGDAQGDVQRRRVPRRDPALGGEFDQLGARRPPGRLLRHRRRRAGRTRRARFVLGALGELRRRVRRLRRATDGPPGRAGSSSRATRTTSSPAR